MLIFDYFKVFMKICHVTGHAPISTLNLNPKSFIVSATPVTLSSLSALAITVFLLVFPHLSSYGPTHTVVNFASLLSCSLVILSANWKCWYHKKIYYGLLQRTEEVEKFFSHKSSSEQAHQLIVRLFKQKVLLIFVLFFVSQALVFGEVWYVTGSNHLLTSFFTSLLRSTHPIAVLHFLLYNEAVNVFIQNLNKQIYDSPICVQSTSKIAFLKNIKSVHLDLWKLVGQINKYFGWNLLFIIIHSFMYIQSQLYWIFLALQVKFSILGIVGK